MVSQLPCLMLAFSELQHWSTRISCPKCSRHLVSGRNPASLRRRADRTCYRSAKTRPRPAQQVQLLSHSVSTKPSDEQAMLTTNQAMPDTSIRRLVCAQATAICRRKARSGGLPVLASQEAVNLLCRHGTAETVAVQA